MNKNAKATLDFNGTKDTISFKKEKCEFNNILVNPGIGTIYIDYGGKGHFDHSYRFFLSNGKTSIKILDPLGIDTIIISGNANSIDYQTKLLEPVEDWNKKINIVRKAYQKASTNHQGDTVNLKETFHLYQYKCYQVPKNFIKDNPNSIVSIEALKMMGKGDKPFLPISLRELKNLYNSLSDSVKNSFNGKQYANDYLRSVVKYVILISIDGLRPEMYQDKSWPAPNLQELTKRGTYADHMLSVFPSYTYPSHTAMLTGALPARSGIYYNQPIGSKGDWSWFTKAIKVPTLWMALKKTGLTSAAIEWPVSISNDITWNIPEIWSDVYPDRITEARKYATPGLIDELEENATGRLDSKNMSDDFFSMDANSGRMAAYIFKKYHPNFLAVHFAEVDGTEHEFGRDGDSVRLAVAAVDRAIGDVLETIERSGRKDSTTVIIVGDHGFSTIHTIFRPNMLIKDVNARFIAAGGSCFLYRTINGEKENVSNIIKAVTDSLNKLPEDKRKLFRIIAREQLDKMGADSSALLALAANPGIVFSGAIVPAKAINNGPGTTVLQSPLYGTFIPAKGGHHGYDPNIPEMFTGFIAYGSGINKGGHIKELCVTDIAPLISKLLGIDFKTPDGKLVPGILKAE